MSAAVTPLRPDIAALALTTSSAAKPPTPSRSRRNWRR
jgi:hypothetical protein